MMREPWFWSSRTLMARAVSVALWPAAQIYDLAQRTRRALTHPAAPGIPVICIGNATLGGVGKTPFAIAIARLLQTEGIKPHFVTRGYGGSLRGPVLAAKARHKAGEIGDEAFLLAEVAPVWVSKDRPKGILCAKESGAGCVILDDGFQNPAIPKSFSILLISADANDDNTQLFPAGPYREPLDRAQARADISVLVFDNEQSAMNAADSGQAGIYAYAKVKTPHAQPGRVLAFSGIGRPEKFFQLLKSLDFEVVDAISYPDHHVFTSNDIKAMLKKSQELNAQLITTEKDFVRTPDEFRENLLTLPIELVINQADALKSRMLKLF